MTIFQPISKRSIQMRGALTVLALVGAVTAATILSPLTVGAQTTVNDSPAGTHMALRGQAGPIGEQTDLAAAAETLGVTEGALQAALGDPGQGRPDFAAAAAELGVTEDALMEALGVSESAPPMGEQPADQQTTNQQPTQQGMDGQPDLATAAETLGVTEEALQDALGEPGQGPPDFGAVAAELGVMEEALMEALRASDDVPPMGGPGNNQRPSGGQPPAGRP